MLAVFLFVALPGAARTGDPFEVRFKKSDELIAKGDCAKARDELDAALVELKTEDARLVRYHERTGAAWLCEGKVKEARASLTAALKATQRLRVIDDSAARAYAGMGLVLRRENNDKYALKFFKKALAFRLDEDTKTFAQNHIREIAGAPSVPSR